MQTKEGSRKEKFDREGGNHRLVIEDLPCDNVGAQAECRMICARFRNLIFSQMQSDGTRKRFREYSRAANETSVSRYAELLAWECIRAIGENDYAEGYFTAFGKIIENCEFRSSEKSTLILEMTRVCFEAGNMEYARSCAALVTAIWKNTRRKF